MNENDDFYKKFNTTSNNNSSFSKTFLVPFISGILGSTLVIGICFGIPNIKTKLLGTTLTTTQPTSTKNTGTVDLVSLSSYSDTAVGVASKVLPSIVGIQVEYTVNSFFYQQSSATAKGSGIIISEDGYILTNNHIINSSSDSSFYEVSKANKVVVYLFNDETPYEAEIIGSDEQTDLAVIKINKTGLTAAELGNSSSVKIGEFAMAIGNPLGMQNSVSCGVISAVDREVTDSDGKNYILLQTDAAINSGNSGGALVNSQGQVIGINTLKLSGTGVEGMGFAIPIDSTIDIYKQLIQYSKVKRPYIGIGGIDLDEKTAKYYNLSIGVYVKSVEDFSAAQKSDIRIGDVIIEADGTKITTMEELNTIKNKKQIGDNMTLKLTRDGKEISVTLTLLEQP